MTHTPGPWKYDRGRCAVISETRFSVEPSEGLDGIPLCVVSLLGAMSGDDTNADALLIAAAPDMLAALVRLRAWAEQTGGWEAPCWENACDVIAKATGEDTPS